MFAVIYQGYVKSGKEEEYKQAWHKVASYFLERRGAIGSCLHRTKDGLWVAYSRWPNQSTRDSSWPGNDTPTSELPTDVRQAIITIQTCLDQERNDNESIVRETCLEVVEDLLLPNREGSIK